MFDFLNKKEKPNYHKVVDDLQKATKETYDAYQQINIKLHKMEEQYKNKLKDFQLFKGLSNISLELLSAEEFKISINKCLNILTDITDYNYCALCCNDIYNQKTVVHYEYFKQKTLKTEKNVILDFNKHPEWVDKLKSRDVVFDTNLSLMVNNVKCNFEQIFITPIFVNKKWWGCLLLASNVNKLHDSNEIDAVITATNMFSETIRRHDLLKETTLVQNKFHDFSSYLLYNINSIMFWMKDYKDRYLFLNDNLLKTLFFNKTRQDCIGKTDIEILYNSKPKSINFDNIFDPADLVKLKLEYIDHSGTCNLTDQLTRKFGYPCKFFKIIDDNAFETWKTPIFRTNFEASKFCCSGTVGALKNVTSEKEKKIEKIKKLKKENKAFQINGVEHFYLVIEDSPNIFF